MDKLPELEEWLRKMEYVGNIPKALGSICSDPHLEHIWDQLMKNIKPRREVEHIKKVVIANRIITNSLDKQDDFLYDVKEISLYNKKRKLQNRLNNIQIVIKDKKQQLKALSDSNKMKSLIIQKQEADINETEQKTHLLIKKQKFLNMEIEERQENLNIVKSLTPVELEGAPNTQKVSETLQECAKKLEKLLKQVPVEINPPRESHMGYSSVKSTAKKSTTVFKTFASTTKKNLFRTEKIIDTNIDESFQLLPDACLDNSNFFPCGNEFELLSIQEEFSFPKSASLNSFSKTSILPPSTTKKNTVRVNHSRMLLEKSLIDKDIKNSLRELLHRFNRQIIWNMFQSLEENARFGVLENSFELEQFSTEFKMNEDDLTELRMLHIHNELEILKNKVITRGLNMQIVKKTNSIKSALMEQNLPPEKIEIILNNLNLIMEGVKIDAAIQVMKAELISYRKFENHLELQIVIQNLTKIEEKMSKKIYSIRQYLEAAQGALSSVMRTQEETSNLVHSLDLFTQDMSWGSLLNNNLCSEELAVFQLFPLTYNKSCAFTNSKVWYRDICNNTFPCDMDLNSDSLRMLAGILENPHSLPEKILLNVIKTKRKLEILASIETITVQQQSLKYSLEELKSEESFIHFTLDRLINLKYSENCMKVLTANETLRRIVNIWKQIPYKDILPSHKKVDGEDYKYFERQFDKYYKNLRLDE